MYKSINLCVSINFSHAHALAIYFQKFCNSTLNYVGDEQMKYCSIFLENVCIQIAQNQKENMDSRNVIQLECVTNTIDYNSHTHTNTHAYVRNKKTRTRFANECVLNIPRLTISIIFNSRNWTLESVGIVCVNVMNEGVFECSTSGAIVLARFGSTRLQKDILSLQKDVYGQLRLGS